MPNLLLIIGLTILMVLGGLLSNLLAAIVENTVGQITPLQAVALIIGVLISTAILNYLQLLNVYESKNDPDPEDARLLRVRLLRIELIKIKERHRSGIAPTVDDILTWQAHQGEIRELKEELGAGGDPVEHDPIDHEPAPKLRLLARVAIQLKQARNYILIFFMMIIATYSSFYLSPVVHYLYLAIFPDPVQIPVPTPVATSTLPVPTITLPPSTPIQTPTLPITTLTPTVAASPSPESLVPTSSVSQETVTVTAVNIAAVEASVALLEELALPLTVPISGTLIHMDNGLIEHRGTNVAVRDFITQAGFFNPHAGTSGSWSYGFIFRIAVVEGSDTCLCYRLSVRSDESWELNLITEVDPENFSMTSISSGKVDNLDVSAEGYNTLRLVAVGEEAHFFVNGQFVSTLDVSDRLNRGGIGVATGFFTGDEALGEATHFNNFVVLSLEIP